MIMTLQRAHNVRQRVVGVFAHLTLVAMGLGGHLHCPRDQGKIVATVGRRALLGLALDFLVGGTLGRGLFVFVKPVGTKLGHIESAKVSKIMTPPRISETRFYYRNHLLGLLAQPDC
jgi:hypothetical protein